MKKQVLVLGGGSWGTTLALLLCRNGFAVELWEFDAAQCAALRAERVNQRYLPGLPFPAALTVTDKPATDAPYAGVILAVPSTAMRSTAKRFAGLLQRCPWVVSATKGMEYETFYRMSQVISDAAATEAPVGALSGPSHAEEVSREIPTSVTAAFADLGVAATVQKFFHNQRFRVYTNDDLTGVELGGALKNIIAIATGIADGLGFGDNTRAALITRGLAEITDVGVARGARLETFAGLSGVGDLIATCTSRHSRNRRFGELIGRGQTAAAAREEIGMVVEGVATCRSVALLAQEAGLAMPITSEVHRVLFEGLPPAAAVERLMGRPRRRERLGS